MRQLKAGRPHRRHGDGHVRRDFPVREPEERPRAAQRPYGKGRVAIVRGHADQLVEAGQRRVVRLAEHAQGHVDARATHVERVQVHADAGSAIEEGHVRKWAAAFVAAARRRTIIIIAARRIAASRLRQEPRRAQTRYAATDYLSTHRRALREHERRGRCCEMRCVQSETVLCGNPTGRYGLRRRRHCVQPAGWCISFGWIWRC